MATENPGVNGGNENLSAAQKLMQKHKEEAHNATIEDTIDEEDLKHGERPNSSSVLEPVSETITTSTWAQPISSKAAGKQRAQEQPSNKENLPPPDTQSHDLFPELGGAPKPQTGPKAPSIWSVKKSPAANSTAGHGKSNGLAPVNGGSAPASGTVTPTSTISPIVPSGLPNTMAIPGRHSERISLTPSQLLPGKQLKKSVDDVVKDINKKSRASITMTTGQGGTRWFTAIGPVDACRQALSDIVAQIGSKVR